MSTQRSSIRGRGAEILFGAPRTVEIKPRLSDQALTEAPPDPELLRPVPPADQATATADEPPLPPSPAEPEAPPDQQDVDKALYEEAKDGGPVPQQEDEEVSGFEPDPPLTPEMETPSVEEAKVAEEPPEPLAELPIPTLEVTMEEQDSIERVAVQEPPPPETSDIISGALPPRPSEVSLDWEDAGSTASDVQEPEETVERLELPDQDLSEEEEAKLLARLGSARLQELDERIDWVYDQVLTKVGDNDQIATECYNLLLKARDIVLRRDPSRIAQAEYYVKQVRARLKRAGDSEAAAKKYAWRIAGWGLFWFLAFILVLIVLSASWFQDLVGSTTADTMPVNMWILVPAMIWGGIGGVAAVFYSLFKHVGRRDFDKQYNLSYVGKPFLGIILGATVYMVIHLMILTLGILPMELQGLEEVGTPIVVPWLIYLLAWVCGFKENRIFDLVDRVTKQIFGNGDAAQSAEPSG